MKSIKPFVVGFVLGVIAMAGWWFASRKMAIASPATIFAASPIAVTKSLTVPPNQVVAFPWAGPEGKVPGRLFGQWTSHGASAGIKGANDDQLTRFVLRGPDNRVIQTVENPTAGNFSVRFDAPGTYTFEFDNTGAFRSPRSVQFEGTYQPD